MRGITPCTAVDSPLILAFSLRRGGKKSGESTPSGRGEGVKNFCPSGSGSEHSLESIITTSTFLRRCCAKLQSREKPFGFRVPKDGQMQGARSPASEAYSLYAAKPQGQRNAADGRPSAPGLGSVGGTADVIPPQACTKKNTRKNGYVVRKDSNSRVFQDPD